MTTADDSWLVTGPRGRRLCWELLEGPPETRAWNEIWYGTSIPDPLLLAAQLTERIDGWFHGGGPDRITEPRLFEAFADSVAWARYWQEPDSIDQAFATPALSEAMMALAAALAPRMPHWWQDPVQLDAQHTVQWLEPAPARTQVSLDGAAGKLSDWRIGALEDERVFRTQYARAEVSGAWWSTAALSGLPTTTRQTSGIGVVGLALVEDSMGWTKARTQQVSCLKVPRVYEIRDAADWVELVGRYPLEVTFSRRHVWWLTTGIEERWLMPDYQAVSADYDAVHLTARGYLTAATRALRVGPAFTMVAGWDPDQTYWLTDCLAPVGEPELWTWDRDDEPAVWVRANR